MGSGPMRMNIHRAKPACLKGESLGRLKPFSKGFMLVQVPAGGSAWRAGKAEAREFVIGRRLRPEDAAIENHRFAGRRAELAPCGVLDCASRRRPSAQIAHASNRQMRRVGPALAIEAGVYGSILDPRSQTHQFIADKPGPYYARPAQVREGAGPARVDYKRRRLCSNLDESFTQCGQAPGVDCVAEKTQCQVEVRATDPTDSVG